MTQKQRGRPKRRSASERAMIGLDPNTVDPQLVLKMIAADKSAPASARVAAARALDKGSVRRTNESRFGQSQTDTFTQRALEILKRKVNSDDADLIPASEIYREVAIHDEQSPGRICTVRAEIDHVYEITNCDELVRIVRTAQFAPEARLFASAKIKAQMEIAAERREVRPAADIAYVEACIAGLDSQYWRDDHFYTSILLSCFEGAIPRERPLM